MGGMWVSALIGVSLTVFVPPLSGWGADFTVNSTTDSVDVAPGDGLCASAAGECTLRAAVQETTALFGPDTIILPAGVHVLSIPGAGEDAGATGDLDIRGNLTIRGAGARKTIIDGNFIDRVLHLVSGTLDLEDVTIRNGNATDNGGRIACAGNDITPAPCAGGGILMDSGAGRLTVVNSILVNNKTTDHGGGIYNHFGLLEIRGSTVSRNEATQGGGIDNNGGILTLVNSTISENGAGFSGGIANGRGMINNSTIANNVANGEITGRLSSDSAARPLLTITNSIVGGDFGGDCRVGGFILGGYNVFRVLLSDLKLRCKIDDTSDMGTSIFGINPMLGALQDNGGAVHTLTHALLAGSPAIDRGNPVQGGSGSCEGVDQRSVSRPQGERCDVGAYETGVESCEAQASSSLCEDGNACTVGETCGDGRCTGGMSVDCDDRDVCTADECDSAVGCTHSRIPGCHCGNRFVESLLGEECDEGPANGMSGSCCDADCKLLPEKTTCRDAAESCDVPETCDGRTGACPRDAVRSAGETCRDVDERNVCDVAEVCDGHSKDCPPDRSKSDGTACVDGDVCTLEDKCTAGRCAGTPVCSVEVDIPQGLTRKRLQQGKPAFVITCSVAGHAADGACRAQVILSRPEQMGRPGCDQTMALTKGKEVGFDDTGKAIVKLRIDRVNAASKNALRKLAEMQAVPVKICVTLPIPQPQGTGMTVVKEECATLIPRCPAQSRQRRVSHGICAIELGDLASCSS